MILVIPCAGKSTRFPGTRPKFLLTHPDGEIMLLKAIEGIDMEKVTSILIITLREYEKKYFFRESLMKKLSTKYPNKMVGIEFLDEPTRNQPETVFKGIEHRYLTDEPILIKDCDNTFNLKIDTHRNFVAVGNLNNEFFINPSNKSYVQIGNHDEIVNIVEKQVVSPFFCAGAYYFKSIIQFKNYYKKLKDEDNLYISHIIYQMILDKERFEEVSISNYIDWGTLEDWQRYVGQYRTLFIDIDGVLVKCGREGSRWGETEGIKENIEIIQGLFSENKTHIILTTSRPWIYEKETINQLVGNNIPYHTLIMGLPHCQRVLINDFAKTNPYPSAIAINIERDTPTLKDYLK